MKVELPARYDPWLARAAPVLRWRYLILVVAAYAFCFQHLRGTGEDWHYHVLGSELLFGEHRRVTPLPGGLHLYANYPQLQIGPLTFLLTTPFRLLGPGTGRIPGVLAMTAAAPVLIFLLERAALAAWPARDPRATTLLHLTVVLAGVVFVQAWSPLATIYSHLDDVLVLSAAVVAVWAVATRRPLIVGLALGMGMAAKPWGVVALPLVLALEGSWRWKAALIAVAVAAVAWLPFVIADGDTIDAIRPAVMTSHASVLHLLGVDTGDAPGWIRPLQLGAALVAGCLAVARRRWAAVLLVGIAVRIALDPQVFLYYSAGLVLAAVIWDLLRSATPLPLWTLATAVFLNVAYVAVDSPTARAVMRLVVTLAAIAAVLLPERRPESGANTAYRADHAGAH